MNNKIDKNFFKKILVVFLVILAANYVIHICLGTFSQKAYQKYYHSLDKYLPEYNDEIINKVFTNYKPHIDTTNIPKTFKEYQKTNADKNFYIDSKIYGNTNPIITLNPVIIIRKQFINANSPKIHKGLSIIKANIYPYNNIGLYYNKFGELIFIETNDNNIFYRYNHAGDLLEIEYSGIDTSIIYYPNKQVKYKITDFYVKKFKIHISYHNYLLKKALYILNISILITIIFTLYQLCKIYDFPKKVDRTFLINIEKYELKTRLKSYFSTHINAILGLIGTIIELFVLFDYNSRLFYFNIILNLASFIIIIIPFVYLCDITILKRYKISWEFVYKSKIYNKLWYIGQITSIITLITAICLIIYTIYTIYFI